MGEDTNTLVSVRGFRVTCLAVPNSSLPCKVLLLAGSALDRDRRPIVADLEKMNTGSACHVTTFRSSGIIFGMYRTRMAVPKSVSTAKGSTIPNQIFYMHASI